MKFFISDEPEFFDLKLRLLKYLRRSATKFNNRCEEASHICSLGEIHDMPIEIAVNKKLSSTYALAHMIKNDKNKTVGLLIEVNQEIKYYDPPLIYQIISHELAHCIDFLIRGDSFHDAEWAKIHNLMDGHGTTFIECP